jgi:hypothetical protein
VTVMFQPAPITENSLLEYYSELVYSRGVSSISLSLSFSPFTFSFFFLSRLA